MNLLVNASILTAHVALKVKGTVALLLMTRELSGCMI